MYIETGWGAHETSDGMVEMLLMARFGGG